MTEPAFQDKGGERNRNSDADLKNSHSQTPEAEFSQLYEQALRTGRRRSSRLLCRFLCQAVRLVLYPYFSFTCHGKEHLSRPGPLIIAPVHRSNLDVPLLAPSSKRHIRSLAKDSMFKTRLSAWFSAAIGAVPVRRDIADRKSLQAVEQLLLAGEAVLVFPEGTRQSGLEVKHIFHGCAYLSAKCSAPIVPVAIAGTEEAMPPGRKVPKRVKVVACVGEPMSAADFLDSANNADLDSAKPDSTKPDSTRPNSTTRKTPTDPAQKTRLSISQRREFSQELQKRLQALLGEANRLRQEENRS